MTQVRWGFLGAGRVATLALAPAVCACPSSELVAAAARDPERARALAPAARVHADYAAVLADPDVEVVYVALTNEAHQPWVEAALRAGKHVLCEKPLGLDEAQTQSMVRAADAAGRLLVEARWNRWHPRTARLVALLTEGRLGAVHEVTSAFTFGGVPATDYRLDPGRGGGALLDVGPYVLGTVLAAVGVASTVSVLDVDTRTGPTGVDLETTATLLVGDTRVRVHTAIDAPEHQALVVRTEQATVELGAPAFTSWREPSTLTVTGSRGATRETFPTCDAYALMVEAVSGAVRGAPGSWVVPHSESLAVAAAVDRLRTGPGPRP